MDRDHAAAGCTRGFHVEEIGRSVENRPLRHVRRGEGRTRVLLWSQMHGDESTASMVLSDLFRFLGEHLDDPQGAAREHHAAFPAYPQSRRRRAFSASQRTGIDINRDARVGCRRRLKRAR